MYALSKWSLSHKVDKDFSLEQLPYFSMNLFLRIESQDAWIFKSPVSEFVVNRSNFYMGTAKCDNVLATLFTNAGYIVSNPAFALRSVEVDDRGRETWMYDEGSAVDVGVGSSWVFFSDQFKFF